MAAEMLHGEASQTDGSPVLSTATPSDGAIRSMATSRGSVVWTPSRSFHVLLCALLSVLLWPAWGSFGLGIGLIGLALLVPVGLVWMVALLGYLWACIRQRPHGRGRSFLVAPALLVLCTILGAKEVPTLVAFDASRASFDHFVATARRHPGAKPPHRLAVYPVARVAVAGDVVLVVTSETFGSGGFLCNPGGSSTVGMGGVTGQHIGGCWYTWSDDF